VEIRCDSRKFGEVSEDATGELRIFCNSQFCKEHGNEIVEHVFNLAKINENGIVKPTHTNRYKRPEVKGIYK